jgi:hypothetical protein
VNPLAGIRAPLAALAEDARVLPAGGGAQEYLQRFDIDEHYDRIAVGKERVVKDIAERGNVSLYVEAPPFARDVDHAFQLFLDGSSRITFLGTLVEGQRPTPVVLGQIGAAAIERRGDGRLRVADRDVRLLLFLDKSSVTDRLWNRVSALASAGGVQLHNSAEQTAYTDDTPFGTAVEPRSRAAHVANWHMRLLEQEVLERVLPERPSDSWLVLDGGLGKEFWKAREPEGYVGVVKNFSKEMLFELPAPRGGTRTVDLHALVARLPVAHRTLVFRRPDNRTAFWYVRLRGPVELDYPLMGVVKVEVPVSAEDLLDSELIDRLSSCLVAERTVATPSRDPRWHAHLYPIYLAERAIRVAFVSHEVLRAAVKWPRSVEVMDG